MWAAAPRGGGQGRRRRLPGYEKLLHRIRLRLERVEHHLELGRHHQVHDALVQVEQLELAAGAQYRGALRQQSSESRAVDERHPSEVEDQARVPGVEQIVDPVPQRVGGVARHLAAEVDHLDGVDVPLVDSKCHGNLPGSPGGTRCTAIGATSPIECGGRVIVDSHANADPNPAGTQRFRDGRGSSARGPPPGTPGEARSARGRSRSSRRRSRPPGGGLRDRVVGGVVLPDHLASASGAGPARGRATARLGQLAGTEASRSSPGRVADSALELHH